MGKRSATPFLVPGHLDPVKERLRLVDQQTVMIGTG